MAELHARRALMLALILGEGGGNLAPLFHAMDFQHIQLLTETRSGIQGATLDHTRHEGISHAVMQRK